MFTPLKSGGIRLAMAAFMNVDPRAIDSGEEFARVRKAIARAIRAYKQFEEDTDASRKNEANSFHRSGAYAAKEASGGWYVGFSNFDGVPGDKPDRQEHPSPVA